MKSKDLFLKIAETFGISEEKIEKRRAICSNCQYNVERFSARTCKLCNCFIQAKTAIPSSKCPVLKW